MHGSASCRPATWWTPWLWCAAVPAGRVVTAIFRRLGRFRLLGKLIEADWHGVLCPQVLATYQRHGDSMLQSQTNRQRRLSRLLQQRHPWLQLALPPKSADGHTHACFQTRAR